MTSDRCKGIQEIVSAAYDGAVSDRDAITTAKAHCATCAECAAFVRFLGAIRGLEPPAAPEEAIERALVAVRAEAEAQAKAKREQTAAQAPEEMDAAGPEAGPAGPAADRSAQGDTSNVVPLPVKRSKPSTPWMAAAAVLVLIAVLATAQGVRYIMAPSGNSGLEIADSNEFATQEAEVDGVTPMDDDARMLAPDDGDGTGSWSLDAATPVSTPFVAYGGVAYRMAGTATAPPEGSPAGNLMSGLDTGNLPVLREVWETDMPGRIIVHGGDGRYLEMNRVERTVDGSTFALAAERIDSFETPVGLPPRIPKPDQPDGWPAFVPAGTDDSGTQVFVRPGTQVSAGFAVAPGVESTEWTWWTPID